MAQPRSLIIGSATDCDIVLTHPFVSAHHCRLTLTANRFTLVDLQSTNGTFVNGVRVLEPIHISPPDCITLGASVTLPWPDVMKYASSRNRRSSTLPLLPLGAPPAENSPTTVTLRGSTVVLGRDPACDHVLDYPMVSWRHARITRTDTSYSVEDLQSSNGTFVNGDLVGGRTTVQPGDVIGLGSYRFTLTTDGRFHKTDYRGDITIEARNITVDVPHHRLLDRVSFTIFPSELVALMGPSGCGKSTLLNSLNGYSRPSSGAVLMNGRLLHNHFDEFRGLVGFVPQDDIIHTELTVREVLFYAARMRLPIDFSDAEIHRRIDNILDSLGLKGSDNVLIGSPTRKGISGGQRKRVNLAMELLTDPSVLFLDEPTSGLSSEDALMVMRLLRRLADSGKTILVTIHQPSVEVFRLFDNVAVLAKEPDGKTGGQLVYYGPAYPDSITFFKPSPNGSATEATSLSPDELLRAVGTEPTKVLKQRFVKSSFFREFVQNRSGKHISKDADQAPVSRLGRPWISQWWTLARRAALIKRRDLGNSALLLCQAPIIATLIVLVFGRKTNEEITPATWESVAKSTSITVFLLSLAAIWFGCSNAVRDIVGEWPIYIRERMVSLRASAYVASKVAVLGCLCVFQCFVLLIIVYWGNGLHGQWWSMAVLLAISSGVGLAIGLAVSAVAKTSETAIAMLPLIILPMVILGGVLMPLREMNEPMRVLSNVIPSRWAFEGLLLLESQRHPRVPHLDDGTVQPAATVSSSKRDGRQGQPSPATVVELADLYFPAGSDRTSVTTCAIVLGAMLLGLIGVVQLVLELRLSALRR